MAIEDAYAEAVQGLFAVLVSNIIDLQDEDDALRRFKAGLLVARQARMLALGVI